MELKASHLQEILTILSELDPEMVMERIVNIVPGVFHSKICALFLRDEENEDEIVLSKTSFPDQIPISGRITYQKGEGLTGWVFKHHRPLLLQDFDQKGPESLKQIAADLTWKGKHSLIGLRRFRSYLGVPLMNARGECMGVIRMSSDDINFTEQDQELLISIAQYLAVALEKARLFIHEKRKSEYFTLLLEIGTRLHTYFNEQDLLNFIARGCAETFSSETCEIYIRSADDPGLLALRAGHGIPETLINSATHRVGEGLTGYIVDQGVILRSRNVLSLKQYKGKYRNAIKGTLKYGDRLTFLGVPIRIKSDIIGCIKLYNKIPRDGIPYFTEDAEKFLAILVDMLAVALENLQYLKSMQISAVKMMQIQRLTALGTLAIRLPNEISNPLTVARLNVLNLMRAIKRSRKNDGPINLDDLHQKAENIDQYLEKVSAGIKTLQEFSTKAGFMKVRRAWPEIIDESLLFLSNDLLTKQVKVRRDKQADHSLPAIQVEPNEGIEVLITLMKIIIDTFTFYDSELTVHSELVDDGAAIATLIEGRNNRAGTPIQSSLSGMNTLASSNFFNPTHFALKVAEEIIQGNYDGRIEYLTADEEDITRIRLVLPVLKTPTQEDKNGTPDSHY